MYISMLVWQSNYKAVERKTEPIMQLSNVGQELQQCIADKMHTMLGSYSSSSGCWCKCTALRINGEQPCGRVKRRCGVGVELQSGVLAVMERSTVHPRLRAIRSSQRHGAEHEDGAIFGCHPWSVRECRRQRNRQQ